MRLSRLPVLLLFAGLSPTGILLAQAPPMLQVDTDKSHVYARVDSATRLGHNHGIVGNLAAGRLTLGGTGDLAFDMTTFTADTAEGRQRVGLDGNFSASDAKKVNENLRGSDVLDVARFPRAVYNIQPYSAMGGLVKINDEMKIWGDLVLVPSGR